MPKDQSIKWKIPLPRGIPQSRAIVKRVINNKATVLPQVCQGFLAKEPLSNNCAKWKLFEITSHSGFGGNGGGAAHRLLAIHPVSAPGP